MAKQTGLTKDVRFQSGIRKMFSITSTRAWDCLFSNEDLQIWLGNLDAALEVLKPFKTKQAVEG
jgi:hypothetical protein